MQKIARFSVNYPTTVMMMVLAIILLGYLSFQRLGMDLLPDLNSPRLFIEISAGERPPEEMEEQFVSPLESVASRGKKVKNVSSLTRVGKALITVEYTWDADMDESFLELQKTIADFGQGSDADDITVSQHDPNAVPMLVAIFAHPEVTDLDKLRRTAENNIANELIRLPGIAAVTVVGDRTREIEIKTDAYRLEAYGLTIDGLASQIQNSNRNMSGGSIVEMGTRYVIRGIGEFTNLDDIENLIVAYKTPADNEAASARIPIFLREVADVSTGLNDPENIVRYTGRTCLALELYKEAKFNTIDAAEAARVQIDELRKSLPGYELEIIQDQARFIRSAVTEVEESGLIGILLAVAVLFIFLRRIGVTSVISIAIPISIIATFNLMYFNDLSLNIMTLGGLALGAGMLVDNAIVVMENIFRHLQQGEPLREAAVNGAAEVGGAITSSTLTTIIVFLPIVFLEGAAGELFRDQAWTVAFSLISSLFVALAVIPMLCSRLLKSDASYSTQKTVTFPGYAKILKNVLEKRARVIVIAVILVALTAAMIPFVGSEFMPRADQGEIYINITLPEGTGLDRTAGTVKNLEGMILSQFAPDIGQVYSKIGPAGASSVNVEALTDENNAVIHLVLSDSARYSSVQVADGIDQILSRLPEINAQLVLEQTALQATLGTTEAPMVVEIKGDDLEILESLADTVKARLSSISELANLETSFQEGRPEINLIIDRTIASQFSLTAASIGSQLTDLLSGRDAGEMEYNGEYTDILIKRPKISLTDLENTLIESGSGRRVRLDEVTTIERSFAPREINRNNQSRIARVTAHITGDESFDRVARQVQNAIATIELPRDYSFAVTGEELLREEAFGNLEFALLLAIILVYMVMAAQFESLIHPFVILLTIPLAAVGAIILLFITGTQFNIMSYIGIIMLAGIAVNDSIILIDRINQNRRRGMELTEAILEAGQTRVRPIIMTSVTTILALLPLTLGFGEGASLRGPMAIAVIGGLFTSTALTLLVIPSVYYVLAGRFKMPVENSETPPV
ncbi:MAG: efflux RND transporter permease subunit [Candidatus Zixiibacteriota bacterium]